MSNDQDENSHDTTDQISHLKTEKNDGYTDNIVSLTNSYKYVSSPENRNKSIKRKNTNESDIFYKKTCFEDIGSGTAHKQTDTENNKMVAPMEYQRLSLTVNNHFENYLLEQERFYKDVIQGAKNQQNFEESSSPGSMYYEQSLNPVQDNKITNSEENFDLLTSKCTDTNSNANTRINYDFHGYFLDDDKKWNRKDSTDSENRMKFQEPFFTGHDSENSPSDSKVHSTSIFSELSNETSINLNETNNATISKTENYEEQRVFLGGVLREVDSKKSDIEFLILPSTSVCQCIENNESFTIPIEHMILINEAKKFTGTEVEHGNKVINTGSINIGAPGDMRINDTEEQTSLLTYGISYSNIINGETFILNDEDKVPNMDPEIKESNIDDTKALNIPISNIEGPNSYQEVTSSNETTCNRALKLNKATYSPYRQSCFSEQDNVNPTATFNLNSINKYNQDINTNEVGNPYLESFISTGSGTFCGQIEEPMILDESTDPYVCKEDKEYTSYLQNRGYLESPTRSRGSIILNGLEDNHDENVIKCLMEYENERLENDNCKILPAETLQLDEFKASFQSSIIMPNNENSDNNIVPTAMSQEAITQSPNAFNTNSYGFSRISIENSRLDRKEIQDSIFSKINSTEPAITNINSSSTNISDVLPESCLNQHMARPQVLQNSHNVQSSVTRKPTKEHESFIISKLVLEYMRNRKTQEFTVQDIVEFVMKRHSSLTLVAALQSIRISLENYTKTGVLKFQTNRKYMIQCDDTHLMHRSFAVCSKKERTDTENCSIQKRPSKQIIKVKDNLQNAGNSTKASGSQSTALNDSME